MDATAGSACAAADGAGACNGGGGRRREMRAAPSPSPAAALPFHVVHKVPAGDSPYVRAKHSQLVEKDPDLAIAWFWEAINAGDRVDSALKDMVVVLRKQDRTEEAIEAIRSVRHLCSKQAQESLDNLLIDLYKKCGNIDGQIELLERRLQQICLGEAFNGKATKTARSHGKKFQVSIKKEAARILGNLGWAYMQQSKYGAAEAVFRQAQKIEPDANRACNLGVCLVRQGRPEESKAVLLDVVLHRIPGSGDDKVAARAMEMLVALGSDVGGDGNAGMVMSLQTAEAPFRPRRLPVFEEISAYRDQVAC